MEYGGITVGLWRMKDIVSYVFTIFRQATTIVSQSAWVRSWPLFGVQKYENVSPHGALWEVFGESWGVLGESWRRVAPTREARRGQK